MPGRHLDYILLLRPALDPAPQSLDLTPLHRGPNLSLLHNAQTFVCNVSCSEVGRVADGEAVLSTFFPKNLSDLEGGVH